MRGIAHFSKDRMYRHNLVREWDLSLPMFLIFMLNPSTADHLKDDQTTKKVLHYARAYGCGRYVALNLFDFRSKDPKILKAAERPCSDRNRSYHVRHIKEALMHPNSKIVVAWGNHGANMDADVEFLTWFNSLGVKPPLCFGVNRATGMPKHPTYLPHGLELREYSKT